MEDINLVLWYIFSQFVIGPLLILYVHVGGVFKYV